MKALQCMIQRENQYRPNQSLQTISCSGTVAAEPLCVPPHEMSDLKRWAKMKPLLILLSLVLVGCSSAPSDPFSSSAKIPQTPTVERKVITLNPKNPPLNTNESPADYEKIQNAEWRSRLEQGLVHFFEKEGINFSDTPGSYIYIPEKPPATMSTAGRKHYYIIVQTPENLRKIEAIIRSYED